MLNLIVWTLILIGLVISIYLVVRQLFLNSLNPSLQNDPQKDNSPFASDNEQKQIARKSQQRQWLEQFVYHQWEQRLGEQLKQWYGPTGMPTEGSQAEFLRETKEREHQEAEDKAQSYNHYQNDPYANDQAQSSTNFTRDSAYIAAHWHQILGVPVNASADQIKRAYHKSIREYHPDKVSRMGEKIIAVAELESRKINAAYQYAQSQGRV